MTPTAESPVTRLRLGDAEHAFRIDGPADAPVVVLVHGLLADHRAWDPVVARLARDYRVLRNDLRGHGASGCPPPPWGMQALADDIVALLDALGVERAHLAGTSLGGMLAQRVAAFHGERLLSLTLANTAAAQPHPEAWQSRIELVRQSGVASLADGTLQRWFTPGFLESQPQAVARMRAILLGTSPEGYIGGAGAVRDLAQLDLLPRIRVPTLVVAGARDEATPPALSQQIADAIPGARQVSLDAGHQSAFERPDEFADAWLAFARSLPAHPA
mgnify:CR=1 FL=1